MSSIFQDKSQILDLRDSLHPRSIRCAIAILQIVKTQKVNSTELVPFIKKEGFGSVAMNRAIHFLKLSSAIARDSKSKKWTLTANAPAIHKCLLERSQKSIYHHLPKTPSLSSSGCYVYIVGQSESTLIKIGITEAPRTRMESLTYGCGQVLTVLRLLECETRAIALEIESTLHLRFQSFRTYGEWFKIPFEIACTELFFHPSSFGIKGVVETETPLFSDDLGGVA